MIPSKQNSRKKEFVEQAPASLTIPIRPPRPGSKRQAARYPVDRIICSFRSYNSSTAITFTDSTLNEGGKVTLARSVNFDVASKLLATINQEAASAASCNLQSCPVHLEDTYCALLNSLLGTHLVNANAARKNYPGIDLIDEASLLCVQITADTSPEKARSTLAKPVMQTLAQQGYTLKFCYIGEQNKNVKRRHPKNPHGIKFEAVSDSILSSDILETFSHLATDHQDRVIDLLRRETGDGYVIDESLLEAKLEHAIKQLGPRYTPEANVDTPDMMRLAALAGDEAFRSKLLETARRAASSIKRLERLDVDEEEKGTLAEAVAYYLPISGALTDTPPEPAPLLDFEKWALRLYETVCNYSEYPFSWYEKVRSGGAVGRAFEDALYRMHDIEHICLSRGVEYLDGKRVLICGEAGIGKSHLLADLCKKELAKGNAAVLVLGSQFCSERSSEESIPSILGLPGNLNTFLDELQRYAETRERVAILAIDALNEGSGRAIWRNALISLLEKAARYPAVRLVLSVRTTYRGEVLPEALADGKLRTMECEGFSNVSSVALETLCDYYGIAHPTTPLIGTEFSNPLYLKLLCRYIHDRGGSLSTSVGMSELVTAFLSDVNNRLADSQRLGYDRNIPLVARSVQAIVESDKFSYGFMRYGDAAAIAAEAVRDYIMPPGCFLENLVSEGVFNVLEEYDGTRIVFSYELIRDYTVAATITKKAGELQRAGACGSNAEAFANLLDSKYNWASGDQGVMAALGTICPVECGYELFELGLDRSIDGSIISKAFVEGLPWRTDYNVTSAMDEFIRGNVLADECTMRSFFSSAFQLSTRDNGVDITYYTGLLLPLSMPERDYVWSSTIARSPKAMAFVEWAWEHGDGLGKQHIEPIATLLTLCLAATNVVLRRKAIKALALVLIDHPGASMHIWSIFAGIDDDYILEGLCGAIYGAAINSSEASSWLKVANKVVSDVAADKTAHPNIVIRDYAALLGEAFLGQRLRGVDADKSFASPWQSDWYDSLPSNEEIDALQHACEKKCGGEPTQTSAVWRLIHSMTTEYGRGTCAYGDFGRYVFGRRVSAWANQFESDQLLSNILIKHILTQWYEPNLHAEYDADTKRFEGRTFFRGCERIGKKYQKIAMNRLVARLSDNYPPYSIENIHREGYDAYLENRHAELEAFISSGDYAAFFTASEDASSWVIGEKNVALSEREVGWNLLSLRSHDPSFPWKWSAVASPHEFLDAFPNFVSLEGNPEDWCRSDVEILAIDELRIRYLDGRRFYTLAAYIKQRRTKLGKRCREATWLSGALFINKNDFDDVYGHYSGDSRSLEFSEAFFGEFCDGWGFRILSAMYQSERFELENKVSEASCLYDCIWDSEELEDQSPSVYLPSAALVKHFSLVRSGPLTWKDASGKVASYCLIDHETDSCALLFDADMLETFLAETNQRLIWDDYLEKQTARHIYRKWINAKYSEGQFVTEDSDDPYFGEVSRREWMSEDSWINL